MASLLDNITKLLASPRLTGAKTALQSTISKIPQRIADNRHFAEQNIKTPLVQKTSQFMNRVPDAVYGPVAPAAPLIRSGQKFVSESLLDTLSGASGLRGLEYLTSPQRRAEVSKQGAGGTIGAFGDVAGVVPIGAGVKAIAKPGIKAATAAIQAPKTAGFAQFWDRARNVIGKQGAAGQELAANLQKVRDLAETSAGGWVLRLKEARSLSKPDFENLVDVLEGAAKPANDNVARAAAAARSVLDDVIGQAKDAGLDVGRLENYFPHIYDESLFKGDNYRKAITHLVESGQASDEVEAAKILRHAQDVIRNRRHGNLELERLVNLPGYKKDPEALFGYLEGAANRIAQTRVLGKEDEAALKLINRIAEEGFDAGAARELFDISVGARKYGDLQKKASKTLRGYNAVTKLGLGAVTNIGQNVNTATVTGGLRTLLSFKGALTPQAQDFALKAGTTLDGVLNDLREGAGFSGKVLGKITAPGFNKVERFNRTVAAWAGKGYAEDLAQQAAGGSTSAARALEKMGLDVEDIVRREGVLTEDEQIKAARNIIERTQFKVDPQDLPGWVSSPWGRVLTQFKTFSYNQTAFIGREIIQPALTGDVRPLLRFLAIGLPVGAGLKETRNILQNRPSEENPTKRVQQYFSQVGGLGLAGDVVTGLFPQNGKYLPQDRAVTLALGTVGGPTVGNIAEGYGSLTQAVQGNPTSLARFGLRQIPIAGTTLQNTLLPYGGNTRATAGSPKGGSKALSTEAMQAVLELVRNPEALGAAFKGSTRRLSAKQQKALIASLRKLSQGKTAKGLTLPSVKAPKSKTITISRKVSSSPKQTVRKLSDRDIERIIRTVRSRAAA